MKHRFFHAFTFSRLATAIERGVSRSAVLICGTANFDCDSLERRFLNPPSLDGDKLDADDEELTRKTLSQLKWTDSIYTKEGLEKCLQTIEELKPGLLILLNHSNRTSNIATILAKTDVTIISATTRCVIRENEEVRNVTDNLDPNFLYGKPNTPDFDHLTDEQHARFVHDNTLSLDDLFPVYDVAIDSIDFNAFVDQELKPRAPLVSLDGIPMFYAESINQMFAYRGTGKTVFALSLGFHLAAGKSFTNFQIPEAARVVYVEGELPQSQAWERAKKLSNGLEIPAGNFTLVAKSRLPHGARLSIASEAGRAAIASLVERYEAEVLILDSLKMLGLPTTMDPAIISDLNLWLSDMRAQFGICIITLHQAGVSGAQRGLSDLEDPLDLSIKLEARKRKTSGASFNMSFTKEREDGLLPKHGYTCEDGVWRVDDSTTRETKPKETSKEDQIRERLSQGRTYREIEEELQVSQTTIAKIKKEMTTDDHSS
jgi:DNA-binding NarL/FixJ family response regulator